MNIFSLISKSKLAAVVIIAIIFVACSPLQTKAATEFEVAGWIPYWAVKDGTRDARAHLSVLDTLHPFGYSVHEDGTLNDLADIKNSDWKKLFKSAASRKVEVIPTVMWSDTVNIHKILSDPKLRAAHVKEIATMVKKGKYAGVDIDYEGKKAETKEGFSAFIKELKAALGEKILTCTIEARTPPESLYTNIPPTIEYVNDYGVLGKYCDRVQLMTYDQGRADIKLNATKSGEPYIPLADTDWVKKVAKLTLESIPKEKIMLGVATYGREYEMTVVPDWYQGYLKLQSINPDKALDVAEQYSITPMRNQGGELSFGYFPEKSFYAPLKNLPVPKNTPSGSVAAVQALMYANATKQPAKFSLIWWSDAQAIKQKAELARELGLRGIVIFKVDNGEDPDLWDVLEEF